MVRSVRYEFEPVVTWADAVYLLEEYGEKAAAQAVRDLATKVAAYEMGDVAPLEDVAALIEAEREKAMRGCCAMQFVTEDGP